MDQNAVLIPSTQQLCAVLGRQICDVQLQAHGAQGAGSLVGAVVSEQGVVGSVGREVGSDGTQNPHSRVIGGVAIIAADRGGRHVIDHDCINEVGQTNRYAFTSHIDFLLFCGCNDCLKAEVLSVTLICFFPQGLTTQIREDIGSFIQLNETCRNAVWLAI